MFRPFAFLLINLGFDLKKFLSFKFIIQYLKDKKNWIAKANFNTNINMVMVEAVTPPHRIKDFGVMVPSVLPPERDY